MKTIVHTYTITRRFKPLPGELDDILTALQRHHTGRDGYISPLDCPDALITARRAAYQGRDVRVRVVVYEDGSQEYALLGEGVQTAQTVETVQV